MLIFPNHATCSRTPGTSQLWIILVPSHVTLLWLKTIEDGVSSPMTRNSAETMVAQQKRHCSREWMGYLTEVPHVKRQFARLRGNKRKNECSRVPWTWCLSDHSKIFDLDNDWRGFLLEILFMLHLLTLYPK